MDPEEAKALATAAKHAAEQSAEGIRGLFKPWQIKRLAKARAEAALIRAQSEIDVEDLHRRADQRVAAEEVVHQLNMEQIEAKAVPLLTDGADASKVDHDWTANFFDKARNVSNEEMQSLWARVLAGEVNAPGTFSRRTVNSINDLDRKDCEMFTKVCGFLLDFYGPALLIHDLNDPLYTQRGIDYGMISHLDNIGLLDFLSGGQFTVTLLPGVGVARYFDTNFELTFPAEPFNSIAMGRVRLTAMGCELAAIAGGEPVPGFADYLRQRWGALLANAAADKPA
jgi:hypothetical protein